MPLNSKVVVELNNVAPLPDVVNDPFESVNVNAPEIVKEPPAVALLIKFVTVVLLV